MVIIVFNTWAFIAFQEDFFLMIKVISGSELICNERYLGHGGVALSLLSHWCCVLWWKVNHSAAA